MPCWGCACDDGGGARRAGQPVLQSFSPINITSENEVIVAGQTVWENTFTAPGGFPFSSFQLFLCAASLRSPLPIRVLRPPLHLDRGGLLGAAHPSLWEQSPPSGAAQVLGETLVSSVSSALPVLSCEGGGCRAAPGCLPVSPDKLVLLGTGRE